MPYQVLVGDPAAMLTTAAPQAFHTWRARATASDSPGMQAHFTRGIAIWLARGVISSWPPIVANTITLSLGLFILELKLRRG